MMRYAESSVTVKMASIARALILAVIVVYSALSTNEKQATVLLYQSTILKQENSTSRKPPKMSCSDDTDAKNCSQCFENGYAYFNAKTSVHGCSDDKPLETFIDSDKYINNDDKDIFCQNTSNKNEIKTTGISNSFEYSRFIGCFNYKGGSFEEDSIELNYSNSNKRCLAICHTKGFEYAGTYDGSRCLCTNEMLQNRTEDDFLCEKLSCPGEPTEKCGDKDKIKFYQTNAIDENQQHGQAQYVGCYNIEYDDSCKKSNDPNSSLCIKTCKESGFYYSGFSFAPGKQCICLHSLPPKIRKIAENNCWMSYKGDANHEKHRTKIYDNGIVDNRNHLSDYVLIYYFHLLNESQRALLNENKTTFNESLLTNCHRYCMKSGFLYFSVLGKNLSLMGTDCFCSNIKKYDLTDTLGRRRPRGNILLADTFVFETGLSDVDIDEKTDTIGCYQMDEFKEASNDITTFLNVNTLTPRTCQMICDYLKYSYSAVEKGSDCHCFNNFNEEKNSALNDTDCNVRCLGDPFQTCGGSGYRMKVSETSFEQRINSDNQHEIIPEKTSTSDKQQITRQPETTSTTSSVNKLHFFFSKFEHPLVFLCVLFI